MKKLLLTFIFSFSVLFLFAQSPLPKGSKQLNIGVGFSSYGVPIYVGLDFGVHKDISVGGEISYRSYNENLTKKYRHSVIGIAGNVNYHFNTILGIPSNWDFYAGLNLGYYFWNSDSNYNGNRNSGLGLGAQIGGRYYFNNKIGINLEFGGGNALTGGKFGLSIRF